MRTLSTTTDTETAKAITRPIELIELVLASGTYRWSSAGDVSFNGYTWSESGAQVDHLQSLAGGAQQGIISLSNTDNAASALVLADGVADAPITLYQLYGDGPYAADDAVELFSGVCDGAPQIGLDRVQISITSAGRAREFAPRIYFEQFCNWIPPAGKVISWGGEHYRLERRDG